MGRNLPIRPPFLRLTNEGRVYPQRLESLMPFLFVSTSLPTPWIREAIFIYSPEIAIHCRIYYHGLAKRDKDKHYVVVYKGIYRKTPGETCKEIDILPEKRFEGYFSIDDVVIRAIADMKSLCKDGNPYVEAFKEVCGEG